jgi:hypothetical protein
MAWAYWAKSTQRSKRKRKSNPRKAEVNATVKVAILLSDQNAYIAGIIAILIGATLMFFFFPKHKQERKVLHA